MTFDVNSSITILGTIATIVFGYFGIRFARLKKYPGSIIYIEDQSTSLFNSLVKNFSEITVSYKNESISQQIALIKGFFVNAGNIDIKPDMIEQDLTIYLPKDFKWLSAKIVDQTSGNSSTLEIANEKIYINLHLFRKNEFICFEALAEVPISNQEEDAGKILKDNIKFSHRIADTDKIKKQDIKLETANFWTSKILFKTLFNFLLGTIMLVFGLIMTNKINDTRVIYYTVNGPNNKTMKVHAEPQINNTIDLTLENGNLYKTIKIKDFNKNYLTELSVGKFPDDNAIRYLSFCLIIIPFILIMLGGFSFINFFLEKRKILQLKRILNLSNQIENPRSI